MNTQLQKGNQVIENATGNRWRIVAPSHLLAGRYSTIALVPMFSDTEILERFSPLMGFWTRYQLVDDLEETAHKQYEKV